MAIKNNIPKRIVVALGAMTFALNVHADSAPCPKTEARVSLRETPTVLLDVDGDSLSDYVASTRNASTNERIFWSYTINGQTSTTTMPDGRAVPADYDGDGKTDFATVSANGQNFVWTIRRSTDGSTVTRRFGKTDGTLIYGCRVTGSSKASLVSVQGKRITATDLSTEATTEIGTLPENLDQIIGCGDLSGAGEDSILFTVSRRTSDLKYVASLACKKKVVIYRSIKDFRSGGVVQVDQDDFPLLVTLRDLDRRREIVTLQSVSEIFPYPKFFYDRDTRYSNGRYKTIAGALVSYGLAYAGDNGQILQRLLDAPIPRPEVVTTMPSGYELVAPQGVLR